MIQDGVNTIFVLDDKNSVLKILHSEQNSRTVLKYSFQAFQNSVPEQVNGICPLSFQKKFQHLSPIKLVSAKSFDLDWSRIKLFGKELTLYHTITTFKDPVAFQILGLKFYKNTKKIILILPFHS